MKKRLLFIVTRPIVGGAQKWIVGQVKLFYNDFDIYLACAEEGWIVKEVEPYVKGMLVDSHLNKKFSLRYLKLLNAFVMKNSIDLLVASSANAGVHARLSSFFTKKPNIYISHGWSAVYNGGRFTKPIYIYVEYLLSKLTTKVVNISMNDAIIATDTIGIITEKTSLIENAIIPLGEPIEVSWKEVLKIVMVARFEAPKRQDLLIESVKSLENVELYLVGDGPLLEGYKQSCSERNIHFLGERSDIKEVLENCHVFALISDHEGLPLSVLEAMSLGLPLLLSNIDGCKSLIESNGILVDNSKVAIAAAITELQESQLLSLSKNSSLMFDKRFNLMNKKEEYGALYE